MKKRSALIIFTLLTAVGYYIGNAVAQNNIPQNDSADGVLVVEEEYGVVVPAAENQPSVSETTGQKISQPKHKHMKVGRDHPASGKGGRPVNKPRPTELPGTDDMTVEVTEESYVTE